MIEQGGRAGGTSDDLCKDIGPFLNGVSCRCVGWGETCYYKCGNHRVVF